MTLVTSDQISLTMLKMPTRMELAPPNMMERGTGRLQEPDLTGREYLDRMRATIPDFDLRWFRIITRKEKIMTKRIQTTIAYYNGTRYVINRGQAFRYVTAQNGNTDLAWTGRHGEYTMRYTLAT